MQCHQPIRAKQFISMQKRWGKMKIFGVFHKNVPQIWTPKNIFQLIKLIFDGQNRILGEQEHISISKSDILMVITYLKTCLHAKSDLLRSLTCFKICLYAKSHFLECITCFKTCSWAKSDLLRPYACFKMCLTFLMLKHKNSTFHVIASKRSTFISF